MKSNSETNKDALRIVNQYRSKRGMVYELKRDGDRLNVEIAPRESAADSGDWCVEARAGHAVDAASVAGWGPTRAEALRDAGRSWATQAASLGLPSFDWDAVKTALDAVRAV